LQKVVDQSRFAESRFSGYEDDLPGPIQDLVETRIQRLNFRLTSHNRRTLIGDRNALAGSHCRQQKPVPAAMERLDISWLSHRILEGSADLYYAALQRTVSDVNVTPHGIQEVVFGDQAPGVIGKMKENGESLRGQPNLPAVTTETLIRPVQFERPEAKGARHIKWL